MSSLFHFACFSNKEPVNI